MKLVFVLMLTYSPTDDAVMNHSTRFVSFLSLEDCQEKRDQINRISDQYAWCLTEEVPAYTN